jgi:SpoVK/Ycf46/Vps4 family AAA+-type ATPase
MPPPCRVYKVNTMDFNKSTKGSLYSSLPTATASITSIHSVCSPDDTDTTLYHSYQFEEITPKSVESSSSKYIKSNTITTCTDMEDQVTRKRKCSSNDRHDTPSHMLETTTFKDIIGHGAVKLRIDELLLPMTLPKELKDSIFLSGVRSMPASVLLYGPPGTGKTLLARAIAGEARASFLSVAPSDILSKFVGESEAAVRELFQEAHNQAMQLESKCAVVFFD